MPDKVFFDTNVLIYAIAQNDRRSVVAEELLAEGGIISVQVLNEFVSVTRRKIQMPWADVTEALDSIRILCPSPISITIKTHDSALGIAQQYGYSIYDALIAASALEANCSALYSEDLQDGQIIGKKLTIQNPFR
ncbi:MAG TPA: PIN domain-containing protein [Candidatus Deferrimicrobiaceae bacterium]|nr:PIN domain-containing protein [Candidatus Deferrimicrobiaceae bacterium]